MHEGRDYTLLSVAVLCASTSPPLIAATAAPALAIAFWCTGAAALVLLPAMLARREHVDLHRRAALLAVLAGVALAAHFGTSRGGLGGAYAPDSFRRAGWRFCCSSQAGPQRAATRVLAVG